MASISGMFGTTNTVHISMTKSSKPRMGREKSGRGAVECSSRPQKKATAHHMKTRPKKTQPWDIKRRGPTLYPPIPTLPPDWTLLSPASPQDLQQQPEQEQEEE